MIDPEAPGAAVTDDELRRLRSHAEVALPAFLVDLERLVGIDCGSYTKAGVDEIGRWVAERMRHVGGVVESHPHDSLGDTVVGRWMGDTDASRRVLLIGHMDTVFDPGTARARPFRIEDGVARGPGVTDMKAGLLAGLYAIDALSHVAGGVPLSRLAFVANPDEEIGSPTSTPHIRELAADADVCLVLECARANGDIVSSRKGILDARITIGGRAAHAGVEPEKGRSAIAAAADLVTRLHGLNGRWAGVTVNVGLVRGGTRPNVVAERCELEVDVRARTRADLEAAEAEIGGLLASLAVPDTTASLETMARWWPMEKLPAAGRLVDHAVALGRRLGFSLRDAATGGASDANTTAGMGVPTIDGLGPVGGNDHSPAEYLEVDSIVPRTTLLAALLLAIARDPAMPAAAA